MELSETLGILQQSTIHSMCIIDELGRGTATHDGTAIAYATLAQIANQTIPPRTFFATHYHTLAQSFSEHQRIVSMHMVCVLDVELFIYF